MWSSGKPSVSIPTIQDVVDSNPDNSDEKRLSIKVNSFG
jgi:hypothetical protein